CTSGTWGHAQGSAPAGGGLASPRTASLGYASARGTDRLCVDDPRPIPKQRAGAFGTQRQKHEPGDPAASAPRAGHEREGRVSASAAAAGAAAVEERGGPAPTRRLLGLTFLGGLSGSTEVDRPVSRIKAGPSLRRRRGRGRTGRAGRCGP